MNHGKDCFARLKPARQTTWNQAMRAQGENQSCMYFLTTITCPFRHCSNGNWLEFENLDKANKFISYLQELKDIRNKCNHYQALDNERDRGAYLYIKQTAKLMKMDELVTEIDNIKGQTQTIVQPTATIPQPVTNIQVNALREDAPIPAWFTNVSL